MPSRTDGLDATPTIGAARLGLVAKADLAGGPIPLPCAARIPSPHDQRP
ncbi:hypothetical protein [Streptomyces malaysiensis]|nr:hypothetical protein [Streptomyces autolyticus]